MGQFIEVGVDLFDLVRDENYPAKQDVTDKKRCLEAGAINESVS